MSFEDKARPTLEPTPISDTDAIIEAIEQLEPGGSTNLEAGLRLGYEQARAAFDPKAVNLVVLASDGVANVGDTGPDSIVDTIQEEGADGIHLVTVGYGLGNYNDHLMEQLADLGDGFYSYVDDYAEAEQLFGEDLVTTLTPVAAEARTQVSFDPALVTSYRLIGYDNRAIDDDDFTDPGIDAGELGAGHHATALYEVRLAEGVAPGTGDRRRRGALGAGRCGRAEWRTRCSRRRSTWSPRTTSRAVVPAGPGGHRRRPRASAQARRARTNDRTVDARRRAGTGRGARGRRRARCGGAGDRGAAGDRGRLATLHPIRVLSSSLTFTTVLSMNAELIGKTVPDGTTEVWKDKKRYLWLLGLMVPGLGLAGRRHLALHRLVVAAAVRPAPDQRDHPGAGPRVRARPLQPA